MNSHCIIQAKKANATIPTAEMRSLPPIARLAAPPVKEEIGEVLGVLVLPPTPVETPVETPVAVGDVVALFNG